MKCNHAGVTRLILKGGTNPCEGYIEIYHDYEWGLVGHDNWTQNNEDVVCRSVGCGQAVNGSSFIMKHNITNIPDKVRINNENCTVPACI